MAAGNLRHIQGSVPGQILAPQSIYEESETEVVPVGTRMQLGDRVFRYASAGAALQRGYLLESAAFGGAVTTLQDDCVMVAAPAGARTLSLTTGTTAQTKNRFQNGYISVIADTIAHGCGVAYKIKSHPGQAAAGVLVFTLYDEISEAITVDCTADLCANLWARVDETATTTPVGMPVGVPLINVQSAYYFWCQTWGPAAMLVGETTTASAALIRSVEVGEADIQTTSGITQEIGWAIGVQGDAEFPLCYLRIAP